MLSRTVVFMAAAVLPAAPAVAAEFFVAPTGNDASPGTAAAPFATPDRATLAVLKLAVRGLTEDVTVTFRGGTYRLPRPLLLKPNVGGTAEHAVVLQAAPGERVVFSGGKVLTGGTVWPDGLWRVQAPETQTGGPFREFFVNGVRRPRARFPNEDYLRVRDAGPDKRTTLTTEPNILPGVPLSPDAELVFLHDWSVSRVRVSAVDPAGGMIALANPIGAAERAFRIDNFEPHPRFFLENDAAFCDQPGEWFLDRPNGWLVYRPLPGETAETIEAVVPVAAPLVLVLGDAAKGTPVRNLHFRGIEFAHAAWQTPEMGYAGIQAGFYEMRSERGTNMSISPIPAAVSFSHAEGCSLTDCAVRQVGGAGVEFGTGCKRCVLSRSVVSDVSADGVIVGEAGARQVDGVPWWKAAPAQAASENMIEECLIERCGVQYFGCVGVWVGLTADTAIRRNLIRDLPYSGVSLGWQWDRTPTPARGSRVERNHIHGVMKILSDGGGVYSLGRQPGTMIAGNLIHGVPYHAGRGESNGLFFDEGTTGLVAERNVVYDVEDSPLRFHNAGPNVVRGNTMTLSGKSRPVRYDGTPERLIRFERNSVARNEGFPIPDPAALGTGPPPETLARLLERAK